MSDAIKITCLNQPVNESMMDLLLLADPDRDKILAYLSGATILTAMAADDIVGMAVLISNTDSQYELKNIAVEKKLQGQGIGKLLVEEVKQSAKALGARELWVGTGNCSLDELTFYQKCGFRICGVKPNYFADYEPPIFENGIRCMDMVMLKADLQKAV